jgi:1-acyl-sn-glycerol-3-phosphate acyltransferase
MIILRIIVSIILAFSYLLILVITPKKYVPNLSQFFIKLLLYVCRLSNITVINKELFDNYCKTDKPFIIVSNHISLWDGIILSGVFGKIKYLAAKNADKVFIGTKLCLEKLGCIIVEEGGTVETIKNNVKKRKANDNVLVIFPDAMDPIPLGKNIAPFKTGAFATGIDILPIIIKYKDHTVDPTFYWYKKENPLHGWTKLLLNNNFKTTIKVLPLIKAMDNVEEYKDKVYNTMSSNLAKL